MAQYKYTREDAQRRGIDGMCCVKISDSSMGGYTATGNVVDWVSKAVANSIARNLNKRVPDGIDIFYWVFDRNDMEPDLSHWA